MKIKNGEVLAVCAPVTKIFYYEEDGSGKNDEEVKINLEIAAVELGYILTAINGKWKEIFCGNTGKSLHLGSPLGA